MKTLYLLPIVITLLLLNLNAKDTENISFFDSNDSQLDLSQYISQAHGLIPIPMLITEPALGYGGALGLVYLHDNFAGKKSSTGRKIPPSISGVIGMKTNNDTQGYGAVHMGYYLNDSLRTISFLASVDINIDTFLKNKAISSNIDGEVFYQALKFRVLDTNLFLGASYLYSSLDSTLSTDLIIPVNLESLHTNSAFEILGEYDARDNTLSPKDGYFINAKLALFRETIGSDEDFNLFISNGYFYLPVHKSINVNLKIATESILGDDAPFYTYPFISLRGMPKMQIQAEHILNSEIELTYDLTPRWELIAFGGIGKAYGKDQFGQNSQTFSEAKNHYTKGVGFRYLIAKRYGLQMGIDYASSEFDDAIYIQFGSAWNGF